MKSIHLYSDVEVTIKELRSSTAGLHKHYFFELIYVLNGSGTHNINENNYEYGKGDVFLLTPEDEHTFEIDTPTQFCIIDFTKSFFTKTGNRHDNKNDITEFVKRLEYIFHNHHSVRGNLIAASDKQIFEILIDKLIEEKKNEQLFAHIITQNIVFLLLHFIARNIQRNIIDNFKKEHPKSKIHDITAYIQQHIYDQESIRIKALAVEFDKSADHLSRYFKAQTGVTIKDYITGYKLNLIKTRLKFSDLTISEIADEMNFADESHLNKVFKKAFGTTAKQFRKEA